jgi:serine/threonine protein kinase/tetratricopeptide (TPR) repeat protein
VEPELWHRVEDLYHRALELDEGRRMEFLNLACGNDPVLRHEVESLLAHDKKAKKFIEAPALEVAARMVARQRNPSHDENDVAIIGQTISHYQVIEKLGGGGMGVVYKARDTRLGRLVALKFLPKDFAADPTAIGRFQREARAASSLNHRNICTIYDIGEEAGRAFIAMEYLDGQTLKRVIESRPLGSGRLLPLAIQIAEALDAAHRQGIIHRDVKPANIFVTRQDQVKVLDFGLAKAARARRMVATGSAATALLEGSSEERLTSTGMAIGTVAYMSPEQARGQELDIRTDLFSLGAVFYEMATGQVAFAGTTVAVVFDAILHHDPLFTARPNPQLSEGLTHIIAKALQKEREQRYQSAADILVDLQAIATGRHAHVAGRAASRRKQWWAALGTLAIVAAIAVSFSFRQRRSHQLTETDTIILADFANSTGDPVFDDTLKTALGISLRQSPFLNVLADSAIAKTLQQMTRPVGTKLTPDVARELCQRAGSKVYIAGTIDSLGGVYVLGLKAVNCQNGDTLTEEQVTAASKEKVLDALGKAASKLRGELGESLVRVQKFDVPLAQATTSSLEALKAYSLARKAYDEKGIAAALTYHQRAIELDPGFAMGYSAVGEYYYILGEQERAAEYYTKAFQLREHASEREKLTIAAGYYQNVTGELDKAAQTYQDEIESYPRESAAHLNLGYVYSQLGRYEKAEESTRQALRLKPGVGYSNLVNYAFALQRFDEATQIIHEAQSRKMDNVAFHNVLYALAFLAGNSAAMAEQQQWFAGKLDYENWGLALASDTEAYVGQMGKARELNKRAVDSAVRADNRESGAIYVANVALQQANYGNAADARQKAREALKLAPTSLGVDAEVTLVFAMAGDIARAESLARDLGKRFPLNTQVQSLWLSTIRAQIALDRKTPALALSALQAASTIELGNIPFGNNASCLYPVYVRGGAYLAAGQGSAAAAEFQKILDHSGIVQNCWTGALAHLGAARANVLQSRSSQGADADAGRVRAIAAYKDFLTLWKDADPAIPILKKAKAEYAKLQKLQ